MRLIKYLCGMFFEYRTFDSYIKELQEENLRLKKTILEQQQEAISRGNIMLWYEKELTRLRNNQQRREP